MGGRFMAADTRLRTEVYSFASYLASLVAFVLWLVWVFVPDDHLKAWGFTYYPDKWWALALPSFVCVTLAFVVYAYCALNMMASCPLDSSNMIRDASTPTTDVIFHPHGVIPD